MQTRNTKGQYTKKGKGTLPLIIALALIGVALYFLGNKTEAPVVIEEKATEDPRFEAEFKARENMYRLQAKLSVYEKDRLSVIEENKIQLSRIEAEYKQALADEKERYTKDLYKVNAQLDGVRKELLSTSTPNLITSLARKVTRAIGITETRLSTNCHNAKGGSGELYCYQLMPSTWRSYSIQVLGYYEEAPTPVTVEYVVTHKVQKLIDKGLNTEQIALKWNAGEQAVKCSQGVNKHGVKYDSCGYVQKALGYYKQI